MAIDDFVSFSEFLGANKDTIERIEREMEQRRLALQGESDTATEALRNKAVDSAYWGGSADIGSYSDYQKAVESADAAEMFRKNLQSDAGQAEALRQRYGAATGMDALLFGDRSETSLGEFLGNKGIDSVRDEAREAQQDYEREAELKREDDKKAAEWDSWQGNYDSKRAEYADEVYRDVERYLKQGGALTPNNEMIWNRILAEQRPGERQALLGTLAERLREDVSTRGGTQPIFNDHYNALRYATGNNPISMPGSNMLSYDDWFRNAYGSAPEHGKRYSGRLSKPKSEWTGGWGGGGFGSNGAEII